MTTSGGGRTLRNGNSTFSGSMSPTTHASSRHTDDFFLSGSSCRFLDSGSAMVSFEDVNVLMRRNNSISFFTSFEEDNGDEDYEEYLNQTGKKRRLSIDQVQFLERSFEVENKLEPDRKVQLAIELGLQPRQIAIWFQNRRARSKTKQIEKDYDTLQASFNNLKSSYDSILLENKNLKAEVLMLSEKLASTKQSAALMDNLVSNSASEDQDSIAQLVERKMDDFTSSNIDIFQSEGMYSSHLEHVDSSYMFETDNNNSDSSQDEDDQKAYLTSSSYMLSHLKHNEYASSSNLGSCLEDNHWSWSF